MKHLSMHKNEYMGTVIDCLKSCVKLQHVNLLTDILAVLATHGWSTTESDDIANASLQNIVDHFAVPLTKAGVDLMVLEEEWFIMPKRTLTWFKMTARLVGGNWKLANCTNCKK